MLRFSFLRLLMPLVVLIMALGGTRAQLVRVLVLLGTHGAIHEFARAFRLFRLVPAERIVVVMLGLREPTAQAGVLHISALATVVVYTAVNRAFEFVDHVEESAEVAGGEVVAHALENVQDFVVGDVAIVVPVGLLVERLHGLHHGQPRLLVHTAAGWALLQHALEEDTGLAVKNHLGFAGVTPFLATVLAKAMLWFLAMLLVVGRFLVVASQGGSFLGTVDSVNGLLRQHRGDLVPH